MIFWKYQNSGYGTWEMEFGCEVFVWIRVIKHIYKSIRKLQVRFSGRAGGDLGKLGTATASDYNYLCADLQWHVPHIETFKDEAQTSLFKDPVRTAL